MAAVHGVPQLDPRERESTPQAPTREVEVGQGKARQYRIILDKKRKRGRMSHSQHAAESFMYSPSLLYINLLSSPLHFTSLHKQQLEQSRVRVVR
jgi:hypothetical protein